MSSERTEDMMGMMFKMMQGGRPETMMEMMPKCLGMMLQSMQKKDRITFTLKIVGDLVEQTCVGMSDDERKDFMAKVVEKVES
jgi:hypothetical protein